MSRIIGLSLLLGGAAGFAIAGTPAPEIDASTGMASVALLSGGLVVLWGRRRTR